MPKVRAGDSGVSLAVVEKGLSPFSFLELPPLGEGVGAGDAEGQVMLALPH